jgi:predicted XRE-type DNA-binding protein
MLNVVLHRPKAIRKFKNVAFLFFSASSLTTLVDGFTELLSCLDFRRVAMNSLTELEEKILDRQEAERKAQICVHIAHAIKVKKLTQVAAAELFGIDQAKVSRITRGKFHGVSETKLLAMLAKLGHRVRIHIEPLVEQEAEVQLNFEEASALA